MKIALEPYAKMPTRAHAIDAGLDLYSPENVIVPARSSVTIDTGVHVQLPACTAGLLVSRSGLMVNNNTTSTGLIDAGYTGKVMVKLFNHGVWDYHVKEGDKISQLVVIPVVTPPLELVDCLEETERGDGGFGSTGR